MEYFEVLKENGERTGIKKSREDVLRDGDWHETVSVWLMNKEHEMLIQQRSAGKKVNPLIWTLFTGGHIEYGEDKEVAAIREVFEEVGIKLDSNKLQYIKPIKVQYTIQSKNIQVNEISHEYIVILDEINLDEVKKAIDSEEVADVKLLSFSEIKRMVNEKKPEYIIDNEAEEMIVEIEKVI